MATDRSNLSARVQRARDAQRPLSWHRPPFRVEAADCISCEACIAACPDSLGAVIVKDGHMHILPELCSGCGLCVAPVCPVDCIEEDPHGAPSSSADLGVVGSEKDPFFAPVPLVLDRIRRW